MQSNFSYYQLNS